MLSVLKHIGKIARFARNDSGATAVEFCILLPVMLVTFGAIVEGSRIYWNYQGAVSGVRDSARYLARITNNDVCGGSASTNNTLTGGSAIANTVMTRNMDVDGAGLFPSAVTLNGAPSATFDCISITGIGVVGVVVVDASVQIQLPFARLFSFFGTPNGQMSTTITDQSRIYGL